MNLQLTPKETEVLKEALKRDIKRIETEVSQTDKRDYREPRT
jgi:translation elongation factor EF-1beta